MKIVICTKRDLAGNIALNKIVREIRGHELFVILSDYVTQGERANGDAARCLFFERDLLVERIHPLLDRAPFPPESEPRYLTFDQIGERRQIPIELHGDINGPHGRARLEEIEPDIILSVRYDYIFKKNILDIPGRGIVNIHPGEVPRYRGVFAPFRAMLNGEKRAGCSVFFVDEGIDTGRAIGTGWLPIDYSKSMLWHSVNLYPLGIDLFIEILPKLEKGEPLSLVEQNEEGSAYYTFPTPGEFKTFKQKGFKLIDYNEYLEFLSGFQGG
ncbi:MAG: methionyl-tRNA formyltransferase [Desulfobacterales bacterium]|nr:methionyl-tRNA formyltransferase [Desulfobacterales bacterium]